MGVSLFGKRFYMLTKARKRELVSLLREKLQRQRIMIFARTRGVSVANTQALRRTLRRDNAEYNVSRKTLLNIALQEEHIPVRARDLEGEVSVTFGYDDPAAPAKSILLFTKQHQTFEVLGGIFGGRFIDQQAVLALAVLPPRDILLASLARSLEAPISAFARVLQGTMQQFVNALERVKEQKSKS